MVSDRIGKSLPRSCRISKELPFAPDPSPERRFHSSDGFSTFLLVAVSR